MFSTTGRSRRRPTTLSRPLACDRHPTCRGARSAFPPKRSQLNRDSQPIEGGSDRLRVPVVPRSPALESSSCTERSVPFEVWGWPRLGREPRQGVGKSREVHTTTPPPLLADPSRRSRHLTKRCQVAPFVRLVEWTVVINGVPGVNLSCSMPGHQRPESFIQKGCVTQARPQSSGILYERLIHGRADSYAYHAMIMPRLRPATSGTCPEEHPDIK